MNAGILTIGDEILIGQIVDTNSAWMAQQLNAIGIHVTKIITSSDKKNDILSSLRQSAKGVDFVFITGGLGPTKDDITKTAMAEYFGVDMEFSEATYSHIKKLTQKYNLRLTDGLKNQCYMPEGAGLLTNKVGSAPGMWFEYEGKVFVSMPGVPYEMKYLMEAEVLPRIKSNFSLPTIYHKTLLTSGLGESNLADDIKDIEASLPAHIKLAYLPGLAQVRLRLSGFGNNLANIQRDVEVAAQKISERLGDKLVYGTGDSNLATALLEISKKHDLRLATAESCTGGLIGHLITSIPGSSSAYVGGVIAYSNEIKEQQLGVKNETLIAHGAVSEETVIEMAKGVIKAYHTDIGVSVSGIAGPDGGTPEKPVGTIWVCIADKEHHFTQLLSLEGDRIKNIGYTANVALRAARQFILKYYERETR